MCVHLIMICLYFLLLLFFAKGMLASGSLADWGEEKKELLEIFGEKDVEIWEKNKWDPREIRKSRRSFFLDFLWLPAKKNTAKNWDKIYSFSPCSVTKITQICQYGISGWVEPAKDQISLSSLFSPAFLCVFMSNCSRLSQGKYLSPLAVCFIQIFSVTSESGRERPPPSPSAPRSPPYARTNWHGGEHWQSKGKTSAALERWKERKTEKEEEMKRNECLFVFPNGNISSSVQLGGLKAKDTTYMLWVLCYHDRW